MNRSVSSSFPVSNSVTCRLLKSDNMCGSQSVWPTFSPHLHKEPGVTLLSTPLVITSLWLQVSLYNQWYADALECPFAERTNLFNTTFENRFCSFFPSKLLQQCSDNGDSVQSYRNIHLFCYSIFKKVKKIIIKVSIFYRENTKAGVIILTFSF